MGIGGSPAALILGAQLADRHGAPLAVGALAVGGLAMLMLLVWQGRLGVVPPVGEGVAFGDVARRYFDPAAARLISAVLAVAMIGWMGFNAGLGGAALAALAGAQSQALASTLVLVATSLLALAGLRWWNWFALAATAASLALIVIVIASVDPTGVPVTAALPAPARLLTDVTALVGYVAVFALRSPDFTVGLARISDVLWPASLLVAITLSVTAAGTAVATAARQSDVIEVIAERASVGNALLLLAVVPAMLTSFHSGRLAILAATRLSSRQGATVVAAVGLLLGILRFDRHLVIWLGVLSVVLVPIMVPLGSEVWRRRHDARTRMVPTWTWAPASAAGAAAVLARWHLALAVAVAIAASLTAVAVLLDRRRETSITTTARRRS